MEEPRKKGTGKKIFLAVLLLVVIGAMTALPFLLKERQQDTGKASILSAQAAEGTIRKTVSGAGTLTEQDAVEVTVPSGVKVTEYLVKNGDIVLPGDPVAAVDRASVMETISTVKSSMDEVEMDVLSAQVGAVSFPVKSAAMGRVKAIYAWEGDDVQTVLLHHGCLAVLSIDGMMAVQFRPESALSISEAVLVTLSDGTEVPGRVESIVDNVATVTIDDSVGDIDEEVQITTENGARAGSGALYVHSAWKAFAADGYVSAVHTHVGQRPMGGTILFTIDAYSLSGSYDRLTAEHREYEEVMAELFQMYQSGMITAPCEGIVSGVDEDSLQLLSASGTPTLSLLANEPLPDYDYSNLKLTNRVGVIAEIDNTGGAMAYMSNISPQIQNYCGEDKSGISLDTLLNPNFNMTEKNHFTLPTLPYISPSKYAIFKDRCIDNPGEPYQVDEVNIDSNWDILNNVNVGDAYVFTYDQNNTLLWLIYLNGGEKAKLPEETKPTNGSTGPSGSGGNWTTSNGMQNSDKTSSQPSSGGYSRSGYSGNSPGDGVQEVKSRYESEKKEILSITPLEEMTVTITVDELDILSIQKEQAVTVTLDALTGRSFEGTITEVNTIPANEGGNTKYSATITLKREGLMLGGMNASALIAVEERKDVLLIPAEALAEENGRSVVYTGYDEKTESLTKPVEVETGLSDGKQVQILSGLKVGDIVWYAYYDQLEINLPG